MIWESILVMCVCVCVYASSSFNLVCIENWTSKMACVSIINGDCLPYLLIFNRFTWLWFGLLCCCWLIFSSIFLYTNRKVNHFCLVAAVCASLLFYFCWQSQKAYKQLYIPLKSNHQKKRNNLHVMHIHKHIQTIAQRTHFILNFEWWPNIKR